MLAEADADAVSGSASGMAFTSGVIYRIGRSIFDLVSPDQIRRSMHGLWPVIMTLSQ